MDFFTGCVIFPISFLTMFLGALSGGVGLITRPVLVLLGFDSQIVVGTSKASGIIGELPGVMLLSKEKIDKKEIIFLTTSIFIGTTSAVFFAIKADSELIKNLIGGVVLAVAVFLIVNKDFGNKETKPKFAKLNRSILSFFGTIIISFFSIFSGGMGPVYNAFFSWLYGKTHIGASITRRIAYYIGSFASSILFIIKGVVDWQLLIFMSAGLMLGSYFGIKYALKKGENWTRIMIILVAIASAVLLLIK